MFNKFDSESSRNSFWHRLNPAVKILITVMFIVIIFLPTGFFGQLISLIFVSVMWILSAIPFKTLKKVLITWAVMFVLLFVINWIAYKAPGISVDPNSRKDIIFGTWQSIDPTHYIKFSIGESEHYLIYGPLWGGKINLNPADILIDKTAKQLPELTGGFNKWLSFQCDGKTCWIMYASYWYTLSLDVILTSVSISIKIGLMIAIITILIQTTSEVQLTSGIATLLSPLRAFRIPVNEWAMTIAIAIRYVPSLIAEANSVLKAQASRGVDFHNGNFKDKGKAMVSLIVPMFSIAFHKADDLSNAMEARNYTPRAKRTVYRNYYVRLYDIVGIVIASFLFGFLVYYTARNLSFGPFNWVELLVNK